MSWSISHTGPVEKCLAVLGANIAASVASQGAEVIMKAQRISSGVRSLAYDAADAALEPESPAAHTPKPYPSCCRQEEPQVTLVSSGHIGPEGLSSFSLTVVKAKAGADKAAGE